MSKNVLITGGAGFIGSNIAETLVNKGYNITVLDNFYSSDKKNLSSFLAKIIFVEADVRNKEVIAQLCKENDYIIHLAAISSVPFSVKDPVLCNDVNINATLNILEAARLNGVKKVVFASTSAVYGDCCGSEAAIESAAVMPMTPYAVSKYAGERYCELYSELYNLPTVSFRLFNVFGPRQTAKSEYSAVIVKFINQLLEDKAPCIYGDGLQTRDFIYINDVVNAFESAINNDQTGVYNIACGTSYTVNELYDVIKNQLNKDIEAKHVEGRPGEVKLSSANIDLIKTKFGFKPEYDLKTGIEDLLKKTVRQVNCS